VLVATALNGWSVGIPLAGPARALFAAKLEACKRLDTLTIPGFDITNKAPLVGEVADWIKDNHKLTASELQTMTMTAAAGKGLLSLKPGTHAAAPGLVGMTGLGPWAGVPPLLAALRF
jgi:hypothetical protein